MAVELRPAALSDLALLSAIAQTAKAHWDYPQAWLDLWQDELTITAELLETLHIVVAQDQQQVLGFCGLETNGERGEILHLWVHPESMGRGVGRELFEHACSTAMDAKAGFIEVLSDPFAEPFYRKMGCTRVAMEASSIPGRELPRLRFMLQN